MTNTTAPHRPACFRRVYELIDKHCYELAMTVVEDELADDPECAHEAADDILLAMTRHAGHADIAQRFENLNKWYA